jgi:hypothetical protein
MTLLNIPVLASTSEQCDHDYDVMFASKVSNLLRNIGFALTTVNIARVRNILIKRYETLYGKSNVTVWRLCQLTAEELLNLAAQSPYREDMLAQLYVSDTVH